MISHREAWTSEGGRGVDSRGGYILKILYAETKESGPLGGRVPGTPPPRSANAYHAPTPLVTSLGPGGLVAEKLPN